MFTVGALAIGALAAFVVGLSKTGLPGAALIATPMFATVVDGRLIPGITLPVLVVADVFAVCWYHREARWDVLRPFFPWIAVGYALGISFFVVVGRADRSLEVTIGVIVLIIVAMQSWRTWHARSAHSPSTATAAAYGTTGGFTTFVANAAGPVINSYFVGLGLPKHQMVGTSAWLYLVVNVSKIPFYLALGEWSTGGRFFTAESLRYDLLLVPAVVAGVFCGRAVFHRIPQQTFLVVVLALSAAGAAKLLLW
ncbi:MAG: sulfite exporter TauE/SafE family protein [Ilumatobacteraceae bacterium]